MQEESVYKDELNRQMRSLARRSRSVEETRIRLQEREIDEKTIEALITRLTKLGFLDDGRYAGEYVRTKFRLGFGPHRIKKELQERGVADTLIDTAMDEELEDLPEQKLLQEVLQKRLRTKGKPANLKALKSLVDFLLRRGFTQELVRSELDEYYSRILG